MHGRAHGVGTRPAGARVLSPLGATGATPKAEHPCQVHGHSDGCPCHPTTKGSCARTAP
jgi:hypothetical protein